MTVDAVREAALARAEAEAEAVRQTARERAELLLTDARNEGALICAERRADAERLADLEERERLAQARAQARATVLAAQRTVLSEATVAAHAAARAFAGDRRYQALLERLAADARARLSPTGPVTVVPVDDGGFVARAGSRQLDYSLDAQLDRCLASMATELERLWR